MKKMLISLSIIVLSLFVFSSCSTVKQYSKTLEFITNPPGAKIEINEQYLCIAPCKEDVYSTTEIDSCSVVVYPEPPIYEAKNLYIQKRTVNFYLNEKEDKKDTFKIYFDMGYRELAPEVLNKNFNYEGKK